jgi:Nucleotidyl transferase AbiEii toxin, Type IV TA system
MHWNTVTPLLQELLKDIMNSDIFHPFRLVGGTSLSLQIGHRQSVDIDIFTDAEYGSIDFGPIDRFFRDRYTYVATNEGLSVSFPTSLLLNHLLLSISYIPSGTRWLM